MLTNQDQAMLAAQAGAAPLHPRDMMNSWQYEAWKASKMREALEEIREKAATMENGGAWAAGMACLCLGTL